MIVALTFQLAWQNRSRKRSLLWRKAIASSVLNLGSHFQNLAKTTNCLSSKESKPIAPRWPSWRDLDTICFSRQTHSSAQYPERDVAKASGLNLNTPLHPIHPWIADDSEPNRPHGISILISSTKKAIRLALTLAAVCLSSTTELLGWKSHTKSKMSIKKNRLNNGVRTLPTHQPLPTNQLSWS